MKRVIAFSLCIMLTFSLLLFTACSANKDISSYQQYQSEVNNNEFQGSYADWFVSHNNIAEICYSNGDLIVVLTDGSIVNLGAYTLSTSSLANTNECFFHLSFDDTMICFNNLTDSATYTNIFEEPFLHFLKQLHDEYNMKISLYSYVDTLKKVTSKYKDDFANASSWLKIGLHSDAHPHHFKKSTYDEGYNTWTSFITEIMRITGSLQCVDRMPRLHCWQGNKECLRGMRDAIYGAIGFLSSEHESPSYYLSLEQHMFAYNHDHIIDYQEGLTFVATDLRLDWFKEGYTSNNVYRKPIKSSVYEEIEYRFNDYNYASTLASYLVFGHEWMIYDGKTVSSIGITWLTDVCKYAYDHNIPFDFPQHRAYYPTSNDIH